MDILAPLPPALHLVAGLLGEIREMRKTSGEEFIVCFIAAQCGSGLLGVLVDVCTGSRIGKGLAGALWERR